jgi:TolA-binding protein
VTKPRILPCLALLAAFAAADTSKNAELAKRLRQHKIDKFFASVESGKLEAEAKKRILLLRDGAILGGEFGCIHQALLALYPDYKRADDLLADERYAAAGDAFAALRKHADKYLAGYSTYRFGLCEMNRERYEEAAQVFLSVLNQYGRMVGCDIESAFYRAVCLGQNREKEQAIVSAQRFLDDYPDAPERFRKAMEQMKAELMQEWESPLYDLAGRMNHVASKIKGGDTGKQTQEKQKEIVGIIEELIKKAEEQEGQGQGKGGGGGGPPRGNRQPGGPADQSKLPPGASRVGDLRPKPKRKPGEKWGEMRDKEREEVLQALKEQFPDRYRELLEQYHKALADGKRVTEPTDK